MIDNKLNKILKLKKLNQLELADLTGLSKNTISTLCNGGDTKMSTLKLLSEKLNVSMSYWFDDKNELVIIEKLKKEIDQLKRELLDCHRELAQYKNKNLTSK